MSDILSAFGILSIFERDYETTGLDVVKAIVGFVIYTVATIAIGAFAYGERFKENTLVFISMIAGIFFGFQICIFLFSVSILSSKELLACIIIFGLALGVYVMIGNKMKLEPLVSISIGA